VSGVRPAPARPADPVAFIRANTEITAPPLVPEIRLHLASELVPIWQESERALEEIGVPPPFWAFAWAGGQALARYLLDQPETVRGRHVLDFAAGSGLAGIAAALAGAGRVEAVEIDAYAAAAAALNAELNGAAVTVTVADRIGRDEGWEVVLAGDVCYEQPMAERAITWLRGLAGRGALVLIGDPGRAYLPKVGLERVTAYGVRTTREIEDTDVRNTGVWRLRSR